MKNLHHAPGFVYASADAHMKSPSRRGPYDTRMPNGWGVYQGPRLITVRTWDDADTLLGTEEVDHATLMRALSGYADRLAGHAVSNDPYVDDAEYDAVLVAHELIFSDVQTGTSLASWTPMRRLVDRALTWAYDLESQGRYITTEWQEF